MYLLLKYHIATSAKIFADRSFVNFCKTIFEDCGQGGATPILFNHTSAVVKKNRRGSTFSAIHRDLCVGASFPAKIVVRSSISSIPLTSAFADAMEDDGTAADTGPRGSGSLAGLSTLRKEP